MADATDILDLPRREQAQPASAAAAASKTLELMNQRDQQRKLVLNKPTEKKPST